jgi:putative beta-lysine N-acetyltransferase
MNAVQLENNYYTIIRGINVYVDYFSSRLKIVDRTLISEDTIREIISFAKREELGKVITNCTVQMLRVFISCGFTIEGFVQGFFSGTDGYFVSYFIDKNREILAFKKEEDEILRKVSIKKGETKKKTTEEFVIRNTVPEDIPQMVKLFSAAFKTYPSPVFNSEYLKKVMNNKVIFKVALYDGKIVSVASAEMDQLNLNAEITDCATYEKFRGRSLISCLITELEWDLKTRGFKIAYSLSRAINPGINFVLNKLDYKYCGKLINNCHICGGFENMNIWAKSLN